MYYQKVKISGVKFDINYIVDIENGPEDEHEINFIQRCVSMNDEFMFVASDIPDCIVMFKYADPDDRFSSKRTYFLDRSGWVFRKEIS